MRRTILSTGFIILACTLFLQRPASEMQSDAPGLSGSAWAMFVSLGRLVQSAGDWMRFARPLSVEAKTASPTRQPQCLAEAQAATVVSRRNVAIRTQAVKKSSRNDGLANAIGLAEEASQGLDQFGFGDAARGGALARVGQRLSLDLVKERELNAPHVIHLFVKTRGKIEVPRCGIGESRLRFWDGEELFPGEL